MRGGYSPPLATLLIVLLFGDIGKQLAAQQNYAIYCVDWQSDSKTVD